MNEFLNQIQPEAFITTVIEKHTSSIKETKARVAIANFIKTNIWTDLINFGENRKWLSNRQNQMDIKSRFSLKLKPAILNSHCSDMRKNTAQRVAGQLANNLITHLYLDLCKQRTTANKPAHDQDTGDRRRGSTAGRKGSGGKLVSQTRSQRKRNWRNL